MNPSERTAWVCGQARAAGFDLCGVAPVEGFAELDKFPEWLARGYPGEMNYLRDPRRSDPRRVLDGARSLIVAALNYNSPHPGSTAAAPQPDDPGPRGWISRYAWGDDYHEVIKEKLDAVLAAMRAEFAEPFAARAYVDTGPILERVAAKYAGLGWLAKNTCLINQHQGSWLFLGVIITTLALEPTLAPAASPPPDLCGSCTRCLDACPTQAFPEPYVLDARRCISYLTIELRGAIPEGFRPAMGNAVIGCDICQDVCPWNRRAPVSSAPAFQPRSFPHSDGLAQEMAGPPSRASDDVPAAPAPAGSQSLLAPNLPWLASLSPQQFAAVFRRSAAKRAKWRGLVRNACVALGNSNLKPASGEYSRAIALLQNLAACGDPLISDHAQWALARLGCASQARI
jgi:epoxyqueuosine reductase